MAAVKGALESKPKPTLEQASSRPLSLSNVLQPPLRSRVFLSTAYPTAAALLFPLYFGYFAELHVCTP